MRTPCQYQNQEPFPLRSNVIFFHDWRHVNHGYPGWRGPDEAPLPLFNVAALPAVHFTRGDIPFGLQLRALPARKSPPFLSPSMPWEGIISNPMVLEEAGRYRLWYEAVPADMRQAGEANHLCYAESHNGAHWQRMMQPARRELAFPESNIVFGGALARWGYHGGGMFLDEQAPADERYKVIYLARTSRAEAEAFRSRYPLSASPLALSDDGTYIMAGAVSPDGLHWQELPEPLVEQMSDTHNTASYDAALGKYVWYCRTWVLGRRAIGRAESDTFTHFPQPETIIWPGADVAATDTWYGNGKTVYPGAADYHLLLPFRWRVAEDRFTTHLLTSPDGMLWSAPPENSVLHPGVPGDWDGGGVTCGTQMVNLPDGRVGVPFTGYRIPHKYPRRPPLGEFAWASWERDRLVALEAEEEGEFSSWLVSFTGNTLTINATSKLSGGIQVALLGPDRQPLPGRGLTDCDPIIGNHQATVVSWRGDTRLFKNTPTPLALHIRMRQAQLFSLRFG